MGHWIRIRISVNYELLGWWRIVRVGIFIVRSVVRIVLLPRNSFKSNVGFVCASLP